VRGVVGSIAFALLGGNGSGKTDAATQIAVAAMLGRNHPSVQAWLRTNQLDPETVPPYPGRVLFSALTSNDNRKVLREKVRRYLPPGCTWRNEHGDGEAEVRPPGAEGNGAVIVFKSNDQGARAYQSDEFDLVILDEEHNSEVFGECLMRIGRRPWKGCYILLSMAPLKGMTWVYDDFQGEPKPGYRFAEVDGRDNPFIDQVGRAVRMAGFGKHEQAARQGGKFVALEGRVYDDFARSTHLVPAAEVPKEWLRYAAIDFGTSNPFCCVLAALDPTDNVLHVLAVHYQAGWTWERQAVALRAMFDRHGWPETTWADPEEKNGRIQLGQAGISNIAAVKDVRPGINAVASRLARDANGNVHLVIHAEESMPLVREIEGYVWAPRTGVRDAPDMPVKANDHAMDAVRYLCFGLQRTGEVGASSG